MANYSNINLPAAVDLSGIQKQLNGTAQNLKITIPVKLDLSDAMRELKSVAGSSLKQPIAEMQQLAQESEAASQKMDGLFSGKIKAAVVAGTLGTVQNALSGAVKNVIALDSAVTQLSLTTGQSRTKSKALVAEYNGLAKALGASTTEITENAAGFLKQGYSAQEASKLVTASTVLSRTGMLDAAAAADVLSQAVSSYHIEAEDAISVADKLSAVNDAAGVSAQSLSAALAQTAQSAQQAGVPLDRLLGYIAAAQEGSLLDMQSIANAYNVVFSSFSANGQSAALGQALQQAGVEAQDASGSLLNLTDALDLIGASWHSFTQEQKALISGAFGAEQSETLYALFENYGKAIAYAGASAQSSGLAMQKFQTVTSGIDSSIASFTAQFEAFSAAIMNSEFVKGGIDMGAGLLGAITAILEGLGSVPVLAGVAAAALSKTKNVGKPRTTGFILVKNMPIHSKKAA